MDSTELRSSSHEKNDQSTGEVLFAVGCRDDRPIVDSGSVVSTCPVDYVTSVPTEKVHYSMNLESVLGESLQHYGIKRDFLFTNRTGSTMNVNFEVTDTKRATLSVHKGCGIGSMIVFTPDGKGIIVNDTKCIDQVKQIMASTPGFDIVHDRGAYVLDVDVHVNDERRKIESESGISFPVIRKEYHSRKTYYMQSVFPHEFTSDYSYSRCGATELFSKSRYSRGRGTERP